MKSISKLFGIIILAVVMVLVFSACGDGGGNNLQLPSGNIAVTGVSLKSETTILVGGTETLFAEITPFNATNKNLTWSSSAPAIATVSTGGVVTGVAPGTATIVVATVDGGRTATSNVTVSATSVAVTGISLNQSTASISVGGTETLIAAITPSNATNQNVTWSSSTPAVATVTAAGVVTGVSAGTATITATADGGNGVTISADITIIPGNEPSVEIPHDLGRYLGYGYDVINSTYINRDAVKIGHPVLDRNKMYNDGLINSDRIANMQRSEIFAGQNIAAFYVNKNEIGRASCRERV